MAKNGNPPKGLEEARIRQELLASTEMGPTPYGKHGKAIVPGHVEEIGFLTSDPRWKDTFMDIAKEGGPNMALLCSYLAIGYQEEEAYNLVYEHPKDVSLTLRRKAKQYMAKVAYALGMSRLYLLTRSRDIIDNEEAPFEIKAGLIRFWAPYFFQSETQALELAKPNVENRNTFMTFVNQAIMSEPRDAPSS